MLTRSKKRESLNSENITIEVQANHKIPEGTPKGRGRPRKSNKVKYTIERGEAGSSEPLIVVLGNMDSSQIQGPKLFTPDTGKRKRFYDTVYSDSSDDEQTWEELQQQIKLLNTKIEKFAKKRKRRVRNLLDTKRLRFDDSPLEDDSDDLDEIGHRSNSETFFHSLDENLDRVDKTNSDSGVDVSQSSANSLIIGKNQERFFDEMCNSLPCGQRQTGSYYLEKLSSSDLGSNWGLPPISPNQMKITNFFKKRSSEVKKTEMNKTENKSEDFSSSSVPSSSKFHEKITTPMKTAVVLLRDISPAGKFSNKISQEIIKDLSDSKSEKTGPCIKEKVVENAGEELAKPENRNITAIKCQKSDPSAFEDEQSIEISLTEPAKNHQSSPEKKSPAVEKLKAEEELSQPENKKITSDESQKSDPSASEDKQSIEISLTEPAKNHQSSPNKKSPAVKKLTEEELSQPENKKITSDESQKSGDDQSIEISLTGSEKTGQASPTKENFESENSITDSEEDKEQDSSLLMTKPENIMLSWPDECEIMCVSSQGTIESSESAPLGQSNWTEKRHDSDTSESEPMKKDVSSSPCQNTGEWCFVNDQKTGKLSQDIFSYQDTQSQDLQLGQRIPQENAPCFQDNLSDLEEIIQQSMNFSPDRIDSELDVSEPEEMDVSVLLTQKTEARYPNPVLDSKIDLKDEQNEDFGAKRQESINPEEKNVSAKNDSDAVMEDSDSEDESSDEKSTLLFPSVNDNIKLSWSDACDSDSSVEEIQNKFSPYKAIAIATSSSDSDTDVKETNFLCKKIGSDSFLQNFIDSKNEQDTITEEPKDPETPVVQKTRKSAVAIKSPLGSDVVQAEEIKSEPKTPIKKKRKSVKEPKIDPESPEREIIPQVEPEIDVPQKKAKIAEIVASPKKNKLESPKKDVKIEPYQEDISKESPPDDPQSSNNAIARLPDHFLKDLAAVKKPKPKLKIIQKLEKRTKIAAKLASTGATEFTARVAGKIPGREQTAITFKNDMLFNNHVRRVPSKSLKVISMKQKFHR